jgi:hypothetical protein
MLNGNSDNQTWVRISPAVFEQLGSVAPDIIERVRAELERVAELIPLTNSPTSLVASVRTVRVDGVRAHYEIDFRRGMLTLLKIEP